MDRRGSGLSDDGELGVDHEMRATSRAVLDAAGSERAALLAYTAGGPIAATFTARHPDRISRLILYASTVRAVRDEVLPWLPDAAERTARFDGILARWGEGTNLEALAPSPADDEHGARGLRGWSGSPPARGDAPADRRERGDRPAPELAAISVPTLVVHRVGDAFIDVRHSREYARRIPGVRLVELAGADSPPSSGDSDALLGEIEEFLTGARRAAEGERGAADGPLHRHRRQHGPRRRDRRQALARPAAVDEADVRATLQRFDGEVIERAGDGFVAVFAGAPSRAVRCASALRDVVMRLGVEIRLGLHTGECEIIGEGIGGLAVHIAARVGALAGGGEILVSGTTFGTVVGAGLNFDYRGEHRLRGVPGRWPLFALNR